MKCGKKRASVIILQKLASRLLDTGAVVRQLADGLTGGLAGVGSFARISSR